MVEGPQSKLLFEGKNVGLGIDYTKEPKKIKKMKIFGPKIRLEPQSIYNLHNAKHQTVLFLLCRCRLS